MDDFIELGMEGFDKVIDSRHFNKIPDKYLHSDAYIPHGIAKKLRKKDEKKDRRYDSEEGFEERDKETTRRGKPVYESEEEVRQDRRALRGARKEDFLTMQDNTRNTNAYMYGANGNGSNYSYTDPTIRSIDSQSPPRQRPQYTPFYPAPPQQDYRGSSFDNRSPRSERGRRRDSYSSSDSSDDEYTRRPVRPKTPNRRRSSSYHGPSRNEELVVARRPASNRGDNIIDKMKDKERRYEVKEELDGMFTSSKKGLAGSAVGAAVGGWAAHKGQEAYGRDKTGHDGEGTTNGFVTMLGAAAGGLVTDFIINKYELANDKTDSKQARWEKKWGDRDESKRRNGSRDRSRDRRRRRRRDSYDSDDGYYRR
ncbi:hypothetical protein BJ875DRAFT_244650 [Amylocarpus encephaloides]|uniref:Uncharacterized protein n=1 Tax=Amylocarpus encephaloides TaxID=45428 RepID=A0A9P7YSZ5_9HELO|nr:hypothetical protein BJ875DRAFT_244650 [Amylocarpus encephaloides]